MEWFGRLSYQNIPPKNGTLVKNGAMMNTRDCPSGSLLFWRSKLSQLWQLSVFMRGLKHIKCKLFHKVREWVIFIKLMFIFYDLLMFKAKYQNKCIIYIIPIYSPLILVNYFNNLHVRENVCICAHVFRLETHVLSSCLHLCERFSKSQVWANVFLAWLKRKPSWSSERWEAD